MLRLCNGRLGRRLRRAAAATSIWAAFITIDLRKYGGWSNKSAGGKLFVNCPPSEYAILAKAIKRKIILLLKQKSRRHTTHV